MPDTFDAAELAHCPIVQHMTDQERDDFLRLVEYESYEKGETILREGRSVQILWIILRGQCEVVKARKGGGEQQLAVLEPVTVFGEMSFFKSAPHSASVRTLTKVEVLRLSRERYDELQKNDAAAAAKIAFSTVNVLADRIRRMDDWICDLIEKPDAAKHLQEWREFRSKLYSDWQF